MKRLTIALPCYGRPERTRRMIECIRSQTVNNWEAFIMGDGCPDFMAISSTPWYRDFANDMARAGNNIRTVTFPRNYGGYGFNSINYAIKEATGKYFIFSGNDDMILPTHFEHYLNGIENTDLDFAYFNTWVDPHMMLRMAQPLQGSIGHSELIVRTRFLKTVPEHGPEYGHDWKFIQDMMKMTSKYVKVSDESPTYHVMSIPGKTFDIIN